MLFERIARHQRDIEYYRPSCTVTNGHHNTMEYSLASPVVTVSDVNTASSHIVADQVHGLATPLSF